MVPLGEALTLSLAPHPVDLEASYPNIGLYSFGRGVFGKPPIEGRATSATTLYRVRAGQFIYSRLFAFEGAYGVVPDEFDGCFVSNEFPTFECSAGRVLPGYLQWLFRQKKVWKALAAVGRGMGDRRQRVHPERILEYRVPLPPLDEQRRIVARLDGVATQIEVRRQAAQDVQAELAATLRAAFSRIIADAPRVRMGDVAPIVRRPVTVEPETSYQELGVRSFGRGLFSKPDIVGGDLTWQKLFRIETNDLVFSNIKAWEGAFAVARQEHHGKVGSHRYLTCITDLSAATPDFLWYYLQSREGLEQVQAASPGSADRNRTLSQQGLEDISVLLPSLNAQQWFDTLQEKATAVREVHTAASKELDLLLPALLDRAFG
jgi:type I restriction enzyme S subunit